MKYIATIDWKRNEVPFTPQTYDRTHHINFGSGSTIDSSSAPEFAGNPQLPNPEELFTASISSCLMLTFLHLAAMKGFVVNDYHSEATGILAKNESGGMAITEVVIKPTISFDENKKPDATVLNDLLNKAHANCFISNSVKTKVTVEKI